MQKQHHKKILGMLGLCAVGLMTAVAASLPTPAGAIGTSDDISVTVVRPGADITNIDDDMVVRDSMLTINYSYVNVDHITVEISWDDGGRARMLRTETLVDKDVTMSDAIVRESTTVDLNTLGGYNEYTVTTIGYLNGTPFASARSVTYKGNVPPVTPPKEEDVTTDEETGNPVINIEVTDPETKYVKIEIIDKDGKVVATIDKPVSQGDNSIELDFAGLGLASGDYTVSITPYDGDPADAASSALGDPVTIGVSGYQGAWLPNVPDTGSIAYNLNISQTDYLLTGLVVFGLGIVGAAVLFKKSKNRR